MSASGFFTILFHALYKNEHSSKNKHPYLFVSVEEFSHCIELLLDANFTFLNPEFGFTKGENQILLTFDDGYFNNFYSLDVLEEFNINALFFLVKHQILKQQLFWWDVYFKNRINDTPFPKIYDEIQLLKKFQRTEIEAILSKKFGNRCFHEIDDLCRPMTVKELQQFSENNHVSIGVHTDSHEILTNCDPKLIRKEIIDCKLFIEQNVKKEISAISYPNGNVNDEILSITESLGFQMGITTKKGINFYHELISRRDWLNLNRNTFPIPGDKRSVVDQVKAFTSKYKKNEKNLYFNF